MFNVKILIIVIFTSFFLFSCNTIEEHHPIHSDIIGAWRWFGGGGSFSVINIHADTIGEWIGPAVFWFDAVIDKIIPVNNMDIDENNINYSSGYSFHCTITDVTMLNADSLFGAFDSENGNYASNIGDKFIWTILLSDDKNSIKLKINQFNNYLEYIIYNVF